MASITAATRSSVLASGRRSRDANAPSVLFLGALWASLFFGVIVLLVLIVSTAIDAIPRLDGPLVTDYYSGIRPEQTGFRAGILGSMWLMLGTALLAVPLGIASALYLEEFADRHRWYNKLIEVNLQNLAAVPSVVYGLVGGGGDVGPGTAARHRARGLRRAGAADPSRHHHHDARGGARGPPRDPGRLARARRDGVADRRGARPCRRPSPGSRPGRSSVCPGRSARLRRCCCSGWRSASGSTRTAS